MKETCLNKSSWWIWKKSEGMVVGNVFLSLKRNSVWGLKSNTYHIILGRLCFRKQWRGINLQCRRDSIGIWVLPACCSQGVLDIKEVSAPRAAGDLQGHCVWSGFVQTSQSQSVLMQSSHQQLKSTNLRSLYCIFSSLITQWFLFDSVKTIGCQLVSSKR